MTSPDLNDFGFQFKELVDGSITNASQNLSFTRPAGVHEMSLFGTLTLNADTPAITLVIEGTHDGSEYTEITRTSIDNELETDAEVAVFGSKGQYSVPLYRFDQIRIRATGTLTGTAWTLALKGGGIQRSAAKVMLGATDNETAPSASRSGTAASSGSLLRKPGCRFVSAGVDITALTLGGLTNVSALLEVSPDGGDTFFTLVTISGITSTGFQQFSLNDQPYIDLVGYSHVRMRVIDGAGTAGTTTTYTASFYAEGDDCDWSFPAPESFGLLSMGRKLGYVRLQQAVVDGNNKTLTGQVCDVYGNPISGAKTVRVVLGDTAKAGAEDLATNATISAISQGTIVFGSGTNKAVVTTNSAGTFALNVLDASAENVYASVDSVGIPQTGGFLVCGSDQETMTFS